MSARMLLTWKSPALQRWLLPLLATVQSEPVPHAGHRSATYLAHMLTGRESVHTPINCIAALFHLQ